MSVQVRRIDPNLQELENLVNHILLQERRFLSDNESMKPTNEAFDHLLAYLNNQYDPKKVSKASVTRFLNHIFGLEKGEIEPRNLPEIVIRTLLGSCRVHVNHNRLKNWRAFVDKNLLPFRDIAA